MVWQFKKEPKCLKKGLPVKLFQEAGYKDYIKSLRSIERKSNWQNRWTTMQGNDWRNQSRKQKNNYNIIIIEASGLYT